MYKNMNETSERKKYYTPIIPVLVNANARIKMYNEYKKVNMNDLCYSDTDSIIFTGDYLNEFVINNDIGNFKIEKDIKTGEELLNADAIIWGTKSKSVGNNISVSGVFKSSLDRENFKKGIVKEKRMIGIKGRGETGRFIEQERNLNKQEEDFWNWNKEIEKIKLYIDYDIQDISSFTEIISKLDVAQEGNDDSSI